MWEIVFLDWKLGIFAFVIGIISLFLFYKSFWFGQKFVFFAELQKVFWTGKWIVSWYVFLSCILISIFSVIIANPNFTFTQTQTSKSGIDIVLVLDLSYSMLAEDIAPNRLEKSKAVLQDFIGKIQSDRVWMVIFAGKPFASFPLTHDYAFVKKYVERMTVENINQNLTHLQWTAVWDALLYGVNTFDESEREKVIVLFTDGEANRGIRPIDALKFTKEKNIKVHTVWIGWYEPTFVEFENIFWKQKVNIGWVDEKTLQTIADATWGKYFRASDEEKFSQLFDELNLLTKKDIIISQTSLYSGAYKEIWYFWFFVFFIFFLYFSWFYIKN